MDSELIYGIPVRILNIYYLLAFVVFVLMAWRYRTGNFILFLLCVAFEGTLSYCVPGLTPQYMRVIYVLWITYLFIKLKAWSVIKGKMKLLLWTFVIFSTYFIWVSLYMNDDGSLMTFSQYSKYYVPFLTMLVLGHYHHRNPAYTVYLNIFWGEVIFIQIVFGIIKFVLLRFHFYEGVVGTFGEINGGNTGTSFPLMALAWVLLNSNMDIRGWKSWLFIFGLLFFGMAAAKRAIVALFPFFFLVFAMFVAKKRYKKGVVSVIILLPIFFYLGLRLTPSLNPEDKIWGSFDPEFALHYAEDYSVGKENSQGKREEGTGRVGAVIYISQKIMNIDGYTKESLTGYGLDRIVSTASKKDYYNRDYNYGIDHRGSLTGYVRLYLSIGLIGVVLFFIYYCWYFHLIQYGRLQLSMFVLVMYDFIFYGAQIVYQPLIAILFVFIMYYSQIQYTSKGKFVGQKHKYFT